MAVLSKRELSVQSWAPLVLLLVPLFLLALVGSLVNSVVIDRILTVFFINLTLVLSLQIFMGNSGVFSFTHIGFMGIGAYTSILLTVPPETKAIALPELYPFLAQLHLPFWIALLVATGVTTIIAAIVIFPLMRLSGPASAIATFALLIIIHVVLINWVQVTNGSRTIFGVERYTTLWISALWALVSVIVAYWFKESSNGLKLRASREDEYAAATSGIDIVFVRWLAFTLSIVLAGTAGAIWAHFITTFSPNAFYLRETFLVVTMLIIGGAQSVAGAVVGTVVVSAIFEGFRAIETLVSLSERFEINVAGATEVFLGVALILILVYRPLGIMRGQELRWGRKGTRVSGIPDPAALSIGAVGIVRVPGHPPPAAPDDRDGSR